jgi:hypothetical protein
MTGVSLTNGTTTFTPELRIGFEASNTAGAIVHTLLDGAVAFSLQKDKPRAGSLELLFTTSALAETARQALKEPAVWTITDDLPAVSFQFVRQGDLRAAQQEDRDLWVLSVGFQELST